MERIVQTPPKWLVHLNLCARGNLVKGAKDARVLPRTPGLWNYNGYASWKHYCEHWHDDLEWMRYSLSDPKIIQQMAEVGHVDYSVNLFLWTDGVGTRMDSPHHITDPNRMREPAWGNLHVAGVCGVCGRMWWRRLSDGRRDDGPA